LDGIASQMEWKLKFPLAFIWESRLNDQRNSVLRVDCLDHHHIYSV
jgi:hypothetical protein